MAFDGLGSSDQFIVDTESRYPEFSDMQARRIVSHGPSRYVRTLESKFQHEQQGLPAYFRCNCSACRMSDLYPRPRPPMRTQTVDERTRDGLYEHTRTGGYLTNVPFTNGTFTQHIPSLLTGAGVIGAISTISNNMVLLMFIFLVVVFICCFRQFGDLKTQIKSLKKRLG
jgi:hypothetical protein